MAALFCGGLALVLRAGLVPILGVPAPIWQDEYSFLLAADTFAHGRLTNPTHPMWIHFESFHIIQQPTYMSMYPPIGGLVLAVGQILGHPWFGQLLATAAMVWALSWMLQGWLPQKWALLGGLLAVLRFAIFGLWVNSYFCASAPALGGALVIGALPRIQRHARPKDAILMALGAALLANSRPYEGLVFVSPVLAAMVIWLVRQHIFSNRQALKTIVLPATVVLFITAGCMGFYFWRVTGNPLRMPYQVNRETYAIAPYFPWESPRPAPVYRHRVMQNFYEGWEYHDFEVNRTLQGFVSRSLVKALVLWAAYLGPVLTLPMLAFPVAVRDRRIRFPLSVAGCFILGLTVEVWTGARYASPAACLVLLFAVQSMRHLRLFCWRGKPIGENLVRIIPLVSIAIIALRIVAIAGHVPIEPAWPRGDFDRVRIVRRLENTSGQHLIIVRYESTHPTHREWVYNASDIDHSKIVWARDMEAEANEELMRYFHDRKVWLLNPDLDPSTLSEYPGSSNKGVHMMPAGVGN
jgi:hypothetical protein